MDKRFLTYLPYVVMVVLGLIIAGLLFYIVPYRYGLTRSVTFEETDDRLHNPLTGFAPPAENARECEKNRLVYIGLTWAEWEPEEGVYDVAGLEERYNIARWKAEKKNAVIRFVCDIPGDEPHMDIPEWLYEKTGDGVFYSGDYGEGYAPEYANEVFREYHEKAIRALAEYCNQDYFVAYVELGSLGHWGEWHSNEESGAPMLPDADVCREYVRDYTRSFQKAKLLMRRNYEVAVDSGLGIYNDMVGAKDSTELWLSWIREGGSYETAGEPLLFTPVENFWEKGPVGGEFTSRYPLEDMLGGQLIETLEMIEQSHQTFIGPKCPTKDLRESDAAETVLETMGYRFYISELSTKFSFGKNRLDMSLTWKNTGIAPIYWDCPAAVCVYDKDGNAVFWQNLNLKLSRLMPGEETVTEVSVPFDNTFHDGYQVGIRLTTPDGRDTISLAMESYTRPDGVQVIFDSNAGEGK